MARRIRSVKVVERRGKFVVDYRDENGKRPRPAFDTLEDANDHAEEVRQRFEGFIPINTAYPVATSSVRISIKNAIRRYCDVVSVRRVGDTTTIEKFHFEQFFLFIGNDCEISFLNEIQRFHMEQFQAKLLKGWAGKKPKKPSTVNRMFNTYRAFFNRCVEWDLISKSPLNGLKSLQEERKDMGTWSPEDISQALAKVPLWARQALFFLSETGRRPIDAQRLKWGDIDWQRRVGYYTSYKGAITRRLSFQIHDRLLEFLKEHFEHAKRQFMARTDDLVFLTGKKTPVTKANLAQVLIRAGIRDKGLKLYGLRHTYINALVDLGLHPRDIQLLAGHTKFETTTRYTHRKEDHLRDAQGQLSAVRAIEWGKASQGEGIR